MLLEICANSYQSAINAQKAGAHRIELCSELSIGGLTPSYALLKKISKEIKIPVNVLIRPRSGNFIYSDDEFELMLENIKFCKKLGFNGIVSGILDKNNEIDKKRNERLIKASKPLSFTFHRAFDCVKNQIEEIQKLIDLKVDRILTSGQKEKAIDGIKTLTKLQKITKNKLVIMPGSGVNEENISLFKEMGFKEIHTSASKIIKGKGGGLFDTQKNTVSDIKTIQRLLTIIKDE